MLRIKDEDLDFTDEQIYIYADSPFSGIAYETVNDILISECSYRNGVHHGESKSWYPSGLMYKVENFSDGYRHGKSTEWFENGKQKSIIDYEYGIIVKKMVWNESGLLLSQYELNDSSPGYELLTMRRKQRLQS